MKPSVNRLVLFAVVGAFIIGAPIVIAQQWLRVAIPATWGVTNIHFEDNQKGWAVGVGQNYTIHTTNGGNSWVHITNVMPPAFPNASGLAVHSKHGVVIVITDQPYVPGPSMILRSTNDGQTWSRPTNPNPDNLVYSITVSNGVWIAVGVALNGSVQLGALILRSTDDGATWSQQVLSQHPYVLWNVTVGPGGSFWAVGEHGLVYQSTDAGLTWQEKTPPYNSTLHSIRFADNKIYVGGFEGQAGLYVSGDSGNTWFTIYSWGNYYGVAGIGINAEGMYVSGSNGIRKSINGGSTWTYVPNTYGVQLAGICQVKSRYMWAGGVDSAIYKYIAPSKPIRRDTIPPHITVHANAQFEFSLKWVQPGTHIWLAAIDTPMYLRQFEPRIGLGYPIPDSLMLHLGGVPLMHDTGMAVLRVIVKDSLGGADTTSIQLVVTPVASVEPTIGVPETFKLEQNYPNPFNPITQISFALPYRSKATLAIYNQLGQRVATLVDEVLPSGVYATQWRAEGCATGVYLCRLQSERYTATTKMLLLK